MAITSEYWTKEWLAYTENNEAHNKGAFQPGSASMIIYAKNEELAKKQAHDLFGRWGKVKFIKRAKVTRIRF